MIYSWVCCSVVLTMILLHSLFVIFILNCNAAYQFDPTNSGSGDYGPYRADFYKFGQCRGPKLRNLGNSTTTFELIDGHYKAVLNTTMLEPLTIDHVKIILYNTKGNRKNLILNQMINKPCNHFAIAALISQSIKNDKCIAKKETYSIQLDFTEISYQFFGTSFFYGDYDMKCMVQSKKGNILCLSLNCVFSKKTKS